MKTITKLSLSLLFMASWVLAQTPAPILPQYLVGLGASYNKYAATPTAAGWTTFAVQTSPTSHMYSISTMDMTNSSASIRTGLARVMVQSGNYTLMALADGGLTTGAVVGGATSVALGSFSGGGIIAYDLAGLNKRFTGRGLYAMGIVRILAISSTSVQPVFEFGFGKTF